MPEFGRQMAALRMQRGWTQGALADRVGVHRNSIVGWEAGKNEPPISKFVAVAQAFGVSLDALWAAPLERQELVS